MIRTFANKCWVVRTLIFMSCVGLLVTRLQSFTGITKWQVLCTIVLILLACYISLIKDWYRFLGRFVLIFLALYSCLNLGARFGFGFPIDQVFGDVISILLATEANEIKTFIVNIMSHGTKCLILSFFILTTLCFIWFFNENFFLKSELYRRFTGICLVMMVVLFISTLAFPSIGGGLSVLVRKTPDYISQIQRSIKAGDERRLFKWNAVSSVDRQQVVVIVLGETTRGDHMSICGYHRATTPKLSTQNVIAFKNAISIGNHTLLSTPFMLTRKPIRNDNIYELFGESSIISAFKEAGFKTYYLSYLRPIHVGDNAINQIVSEADVYIQRPWGEKQDSLLLPLVSNIINQDKSRKKLIIVKLIGSHFNYQDMYPIEFDYFKPSFKTVKYLGGDPSKKDIFINSYDNSILHTDHVVSEIINMLRRQPETEVSLSFISDHGTSIYDDGKTLYGGALKANYNAALFFWLGDGVISRLGDKVGILKSNTDKPVDSTYFVDSIMTLSGIETEKKVGKNLFEDTIDDKDFRLVIVGDKVIPYVELK